MAKFEVGERVEAAVRMSFRLLDPDVHEGEKGVVREVSGGLTDRYLVKFHNGQEGWVDEGQLHPA